MREEKIWWGKWIWAAGLLVAIILPGYLPLSDTAIERYYSEGLYQGIASAMHLLFSWVPFSVGDVMYIAIIIYAVVTVIIIIRRVIHKNYKAAGDHLFKLVIGTEALVLLFYIFWGGNYYRPPAAKVLALQDSVYTIDDVKKVTALIIDSAKSTRNSVGIADLAVTDDVIYGTAANAVKNMAPLAVQFRTYRPAVKSSILSPLLNYMSVAGYFNPFTNEAQVNRLMPVFDKPFTACHEMSHQMGFGREDEANFAGYLAGVRSKDKLLNYSAYYTATIEFLRYLHRRDTTGYRQLKANLSTAVRHDLKTDSLYWAQYEGPLGSMSNRFYDGFLKANRQPAGLRTYNRMIPLAMAWYKKQGVY